MFLLHRSLWLMVGAFIVIGHSPRAVAVEEGQRLATQAQRIREAMIVLGSELPAELASQLAEACRIEDGQAIQRLLDTQIVASVTISPESRVKVVPGKAPAEVQQAGYTPWLIKVNNQGAIKAPLQVRSPQAGPSYSGVALLSMQRQDQLALLADAPPTDGPRRFLHCEWYEQPPMTTVPSGAPTDYAILLVYSSEAGLREAVFDFSVGSGTQDLGFRAQLPLVFTAKQAHRVQLRIRDQQGSPAFAKLVIRDQRGHIYPPQPRRLAPDFFFQQQIYREDGESILLPAGEFMVESSQGPETVVQRISRQVADGPSNQWDIEIASWVKPARYGWFSGDHHIHGAGCAHYTSPSEGVTPADMFRQIAGEGLNVGCVLTWGPCFEHQRQFFRPEVDQLSRPTTLMKYDIEISGFGSQALGHVCLLNLRDQDYPGSGGTKTKGWPTWATPALKWAKAQGAVTGFAHSASGLQIDPARAAKRLFDTLDVDLSGLVSASEAEAGLLPTQFNAIDTDRDQGISQAELQTAIDQAADELPNLAIPEMNSVGAMELPVAVTVGACDFISTMDTARVAEWNMWYHVLNCGFALKASGETDFPCMSGNCVGQGRVYVQLGQVQQIDFDKWCQGLAEGRSYVSDGYAHALEFLATDGKATARSGDRLTLAEAANVTIGAKVAIAAEMPTSVAYGTRLPEGGRRWIGDTVTWHGSRSEQWSTPGTRLVELVVNGQAIASQVIPCDGQEHLCEFKDVPVSRSSWIAVRSFPHLHTNPIEVLVADQPIRASAQSAQWCIATIEQLWQQRGQSIASDERQAARDLFDQAIGVYRQRANESQP